MAKITTPRTWLLDETPMKMYFDNQVFTFIANNQTFHECTKHVEVDCQNQKGGGGFYICCLLYSMGPNFLVEYSHC